jgi:TetR/AcrR family transcriptional regulator, acrAB operon repressor
MARKTKEEADITRHALLKAALAVFSRQGYSATRLEDIAAEAGVTRGAIYHHFGSKADLFNTLIGNVSARVDSVIEAALVAEGTWLERIRLAFVDAAAVAAHDEEYLQTMELVMFKTGYDPELEKGMEIKLAFWHETVSAITQGMAAAQEAGELRAELDPFDAAIDYLALQNGLLTSWLLDRTLFSLKDRAYALIDIYIRGIQA